MLTENMMYTIWVRPAYEGTISGGWSPLACNVPGTDPRDAIRKWRAENEKHRHMWSHIWEIKSADWQAKLEGTGEPVWTERRKWPATF